MKEAINKLNEIQQKLKAPKSQRNTFGNYNYRSCEDILEAVKPLLGEASIVINDEIVEVGGRIYVKATATLMIDGESVSANAYAREAESKKGMDSAQVTGATSSYARKYALNGLLLIDDTKDSDATNKHDDAENKEAAERARIKKEAAEENAKFKAFCKACKAVDPTLTDAELSAVKPADRKKWHEDIKAKQENK